MPVVTTYSDGVPAVAYCVLDGAGRPLAERRADTVFYAASTVKLGVMLAGFLAAEAGELSLEERLACTRRFPSGAPGAPDFAVGADDADAAFPEDGASATIAELIHMMVARSSNEATNVLLDRLGFARVASAFARCGAVHTRMERRIGDLAAAGLGQRNETTARDLTAVMRSAATGVLAADSTGPGLGEGSIVRMRAILADQRHPRIGLVVPAGTPWGSKSGDVPGIEHDVAFIGRPGDPSRSPAPYRYLAVCTRGFEPEQGREVIQALAAALLGRGAGAH